MTYTITIADSESSREIESEVSASALIEIMGLLLQQKKEVEEDVEEDEVVEEEEPAPRRNIKSRMQRIEKKVKGQKVCKKCGRPGHMAKTCTENKEEEGETLDNFKPRATADDVDRIWYQRDNGEETSSLAIAKMLGLPIGVVNDVLSKQRP